MSAGINHSEYLKKYCDLHNSIHFVYAAFKSQSLNSERHLIVTKLSKKLWAQYAYFRSVQNTIYKHINNIDGTFTMKFINKHSVYRSIRMHKIQQINLEF